MRIERIPCTLIHGADLLLRRRIVCERRPEIFTERGEQRGCVIFPVLFEFLHPRSDLCCVLRQMIEQTLEVA